MKMSLMKKVFALPVLLLFFFTGFTQHYYNDIISTQQSNANYLLLKSTNQNQVRGISFESDNSQTPNFKLQQELTRDRKKLITTTTSPANITTVTVSHFENDKLRRTSDSLSSVSNITEYEYNTDGKLSKITTQSIDPEHSGSTIEVHQWFYKSDGSPDHMLKIKNRTDTVKVGFLYDEKDNLAEERWMQKNRLLETYFYYYNDKKQLTDVVRYHSKSKKLLPDFIFEYDANGRVSQMMQTLQGTATYLLWQYTYNENGLKIKEVAYDKQRRLVGRIEYAYSK